MPFSDNPLRGCPLMNRPDTLAALTDQYGARSTHLRHDESAAQLSVKTLPVAESWKSTADRLYSGYSRSRKRMFRQLLQYMNIKKRLIDR